MRTRKIKIVTFFSHNNFCDCIFDTIISFNTRKSARKPSIGSGSLYCTRSFQFSNLYIWEWEVRFDCSLHVVKSSSQY